MSSKKLLFIVNVDWFFLSHRLPVAEAALRAGYEVHLACAVTSGRAEIESRGIVLHDLPIRRRGTAIGGELRALTAMLSLMRALRPDIVHLVTIKPVLLGGIAARCARVQAVIAAISGMGFVFIARGFIARARRAPIALLYRLALRAVNVTIIVQNEDDARLVSKLTGVPPLRMEMIRGSGVDLDQCRAEPLSQGVPTVVFAARLLVDKGLREFVSAARLLRQKELGVRFIVAGTIDPDNPATVTQEEVDEWQREGVAEFHGFRPDIGRLFAEAHIVVLPSYREGLPKALLEAAACGRAVITTDVPGCRDAIEDGRTGLLVPVMKVEPLAAAIERLVQNRDECARMGKAGRALAEAKFGIEQVVASHLRIYTRAAGQPA